MAEWQPQEGDRVSIMGVGWGTIRCVLRPSTSIPDRRYGVETDDSKDDPTAPYIYCSRDEIVYWWGRAEEVTDPVPAAAPRFYVSLTFDTAQDTAALAIRGPIADVLRVAGMVRNA